MRRVGYGLMGSAWLLLCLGLAQAQQLKLEPVAPARSETVDPVMEQVHRLMAAGRFAEAEALLQEQVRADAASGDLRYALAYCYLRLNEPSKALAEYTQAASLRTPRSEELMQVGQAYVLLGDTADADRWTLQAIRMDPKSAEAWYSLGRIRYTEQRFADAEGCFQKALALAPGSAKAENNLGLAEEGLNDTDAAAAAYRQAIAWEGTASGPGAEQPYLNLAIVLLHRGQMQEAQTLLERAAAISPHDPRILEQVGQLHLQQGDAKGAAAAFSEAVELDPKNSGLHFLLGQSYRRLGEKEEAQAEFARAERLVTPAPKTEKP